MLYSEKVMDRFKNPRNVGEIENSDGVGEVGNAKCGDIMRMQIKVENNIITDAKFMTFGCAKAFKIMGSHQKACRPFHGLHIQPLSHGIPVFSLKHLAFLCHVQPVCIYFFHGIQAAVKPGIFLLLPLEC